MKAKVIVLPKRDFNYKLKLVSNDDWWKTFEFFWALALEKTQIRHNLPVPSSFSDPMKFASLCWWSLPNLFSGASLYFLLALLLARYSPFLLMSFLVFFRVPLAVFCVGVLSNFQARFSRLVLRLLLVFLVALPISFHPIFTQNPLSTNLNYKNFFPFTKL